MAHVISTINLKGGVGKTTTTVALAETLSSEFRKRVLVIDLDPQANATTMLLGERKWHELSNTGRTLAQMFEDALERSNKQFHFDNILQKGVSDVRTPQPIDLLPSSPDLIDVQEQLELMSSGPFNFLYPTEILRSAVNSKLRGYDIVIVDCPPSLGIITRNGLRISQGYIIPTIPDYLSTNGIPQVIKKVSRFSSAIDEPIEPLGVVVTKFQEQSSVHQTVLQDLRREKFAPVFRTTIPQANSIAAAAAYSAGSRTLKQKYGYGSLAESYRSLAVEILNKLER